MQRGSVPLFTAALALALSACASDGRYPSLARRDVERIRGTVEPVTPQMPSPAITAPPSAELETRLASLVEQAQAAHAHFSANLDRTERLVTAADGAAIASESWAVASVALADLEAARSKAMIALADLDQLYAAERVEHFESESITAKVIARARDKVSALVAQEDPALAGLRNRLARQSPAG